MVFKITSIKRRHRRTSAWTLVELMCAIGISGILGIAFLSATAYSGRTFQGLNNYVDLDDRSRRSLDIMMNDIRSATLVTYYNTNTSNALYIKDAKGSPIQFDYSATTRKLTRTDTNSTRTLLTGCNSLEFSMFKRTPPTGTNVWISTTKTNWCKLVQVNWTCSRDLSVLGTNWNTESVQTAKIVIRNEPTNEPIP